ncbi:MAG: penicillin-binding protein 2 [Alphaproteobacteria bacterium]|nr:penicillin-binding protein 2 [Alphaproteobacteria bacterium]
MTMTDARLRRHTIGEALRPTRRPRREGAAARRLETGRGRVVLASLVFAIAFAGLGVRLIDVALLSVGNAPQVAHRASTNTHDQRAVILDRNGIILATTLRTYSLYADARQVPNAMAAATHLVRILPNLKHAKLLRKLKSNRRFIWLRRHLTPDQYQSVNSLGIPGLYVRADKRRVYPLGRLASHVLGFTDRDNSGLAGIEKFFDERLRKSRKPIRLSLDIRLQYVLRGEMAAAIKRYRAKAGTALLLNTSNGEVLAIVSLPDFDPNDATAAPAGNRFNQATLGVYEMGSTFKILNTALALESGTARLTDRFDARQPIRVARFRIRDYSPAGRWLSVDEIFVKSSNIGSAKMALAFGGARQRKFLDTLGLLHPARIEVPEIGVPLWPKNWRPINTMTISFGHGVAVTPVQFSAAVAATVNGGRLIAPTLVKRVDGEQPRGRQVVSEETSRRIRYLMRQVVLRGTGRRAAAPGYLVGGKTGSADKSTGAPGKPRGLLSSFIGAFPMHRPRYVLLVMLDEPKGNKDTRFKATGGLVAAPTFAKIVARIAPILKLQPIEENMHDRLWAPMRMKPGVRRIASYRVNGRERR